MVVMASKNAIQIICVFVALVSASRADNNEGIGDAAPFPPLPREVEGIPRSARMEQRNIRIHTRCPTPVYPKNGYIVGEVTRVGAVLQIHCNDGYMLSGPAEVTCVHGKDGAFWSPGLPQTCLQPEEPTHAGTNQLHDLCQLKPDAGPCDGHIKQYYFNETTMECHKFVYTGCQGNANRFDTMKECNSACLGSD